MRYWAGWGGTAVVGSKVRSSDQVAVIAGSGIWAKGKPVCAVECGCVG